MQTAEYVALDALALAQLIRAGEVTPAEVLDAALSLIERHDPTVGALAARYPDRARAAVEAGLPDGPLRGVPFALKDLWTSWSGTATCNGSRLFSDNVAPHNDEVVRRYERAGLVLMGKTKSAELGVSPTTEPALYGAVCNPWDLTRSAGGSSGGAAAAVAAGMLPFAHATDGGGSIRIPASRCGLFGLKPTRGRVSASPRGEGWGGLSAQNVVSRSVRDSAAALDAVAGPVAGDPYCAPPPAGRFLDEVGRPPRRLRVGLCTSSLNGSVVDPQVIAAARCSAHRLASLGHEVVEVDWPVPVELILAAQGSIIPAQVAAAVDARLEELGRPLRDDDLEPVTVAFADWGRRATARSYIAGVQAVHEIGRRMGAMLLDLEVLVTPTCGDVAPPLGLLDGSDLDSFVASVGPAGAFTSVANASGQPAMSLPLDVATDGTPIGTQVIGRFGDEATLLRLAGQLEQAHAWPRTVRQEAPA